MLSLPLAAQVLVDNGDQSIAQWTVILLDALHNFYSANRATRRKAVAEAQRFIRFLIARGVVYWWQVTPELVAEFLWAARPDRNGRHRSVSAATARNRRGSVGSLLRIAVMLGLNINPRDLLGDPLGSTPPQVSTRPLTAAEAQAVRDCADAGLWVSTAPVMIAIGFAGGSPEETGVVAAADIDLAEGSVRFGGAARRVNPLDEWGLGILRDHIAHMQPPPSSVGPLCVTSALPSHRATHSVTVRLRNVLIDAGISGRPGVTAGSVRLTTAAAIAQERGIAAAALFLGNRSLDRTAAALGWKWDGADLG